MDKKISAAAAAASAAVIMMTAAVSPLYTSAKEWVRVSEWAYNEVSNFRSEGLMPQSFDDVSDYRAAITRGRFAELIYTAADKAGAIPVSAKGTAVFSDTAGAGSAADSLAACGVLSGVSEGVFAPDGTVTREDAAVMLYNTAKLIDGRVFDFGYTVEAFADGGAISDYAAEAVEALCALGVISGLDGSVFAPKSGITIEQAVLMTYRMYNELPVFNSGGSPAVSADSGEVILRSFNNGYYESKQGNRLFLSDGVDRVMEFETDIYSDIICCTNSTANYVFGLRYDKTTDVYDIDTKAFLFNIPYRVMSCSDKYIFVTTKESSSLFGVYGLDGSEVLPPQYTVNDLRGKGYYDITATLTELPDEALISSVKLNNVSDIGRTVWVGSPSVELSWYEDGTVCGDWEESINDTGISERQENGAAVLTNANGCTYFEMTWMGMNEEKTAEFAKAFEAGASTDDIAGNGANYTELYRVEMTETVRRIGEDFGVEGLFRISRNGNVLFDGVRGYISYMPPDKGWYSGQRTVLTLELSANGREYTLSANIRFGGENTSADGVNARIINKSSDTAEIRLGRTKSSIVDGGAVTGETEYSGSVFYNRKYGVSRVFINAGDLSVWTPIEAKPALSENTITGDFYVQYMRRGYPITDVFSGTLAGIGGDGDITLRSDDGRYDMTFARRTETGASAEAALRGTREVSEFTADGEPYFTGTPAEQDEYDLQEHDAPVKRIVVDGGGKVMFVVPAEWQEYPLAATKEGDGHENAGSWQQLCEKLAAYMDADRELPPKWLIWDAYIGEAIAVVPQEYIFAESTETPEAHTFVKAGDEDE